MLHNENYTYFVINNNCSIKAVCNKVANLLFVKFILCKKCSTLSGDIFVLLWQHLNNKYLLN